MFASLRGLLLVVVATGQITSSTAIDRTAARSPSASSTTSAWPCPTSASEPANFALRLVGGEYYPDPGYSANYSGHFLGVSPDGNTVVGAPSVNATTTLWYLDNSLLYVNSSTTRNATYLDGQPVMGQPFDNNWDEFENAFTFNTTASMQQCYGICNTVTCEIMASSDFAYGALNCSAPAYPPAFFIQIPYTTDAYFGIWDETQSAGGTYGRPAEDVSVEIVPSCKLS